MSQEKFVKLSDVIALMEEINGRNIDEVIAAINNLKTVDQYNEIEKLFPYKLNDTIYEISYLWDDPCVRPYKITSISKLILINKDFGKTYFLTREEAEEKLKKVLNREHD